MKAGRLLGILHYLLAHGRTPARVLAQRFEVTERTILRDMDDLSEFGVPVYAIQGQGGGWEIDRRYVLPAGLLQEQEQSQILAALEASQADDGLLDKLRAHFKGSQRTDHWLLVDQTTWHQSPHLSRDFDWLKQAILERRLVTFRYCSNQGSWSQRQVEPARLVLKHYRWYLYAWCRERQAFRYFKLSRMQDLQVLAQGFESDYSHLDLPQTLFESDLSPVSLRFDDQVAYRVYDDFAGLAVKDDQGGLLVETQLPISQDLVAYLLSYGAHIQVLAPRSLAQAFQHQIKEMWQRTQP